jgi:hypothetical protein
VYFSHNFMERDSVYLSKNIGDKELGQVPHGRFSIPEVLNIKL